jgi:hypothetical protein
MYRRAEALEWTLPAPRDVDEFLMILPRWLRNANEGNHERTIYDNPPSGSRTATEGLQLH